MIDLTSGDWTALLRTPDLRLVGVEFGRLRFDRPFRLAKPDPSRANFYLVRKGGAWFRAQGGKAIFLPTGSVVGVEGRSHEWLDSSQLHPAERGARHGNADFAGALPVEIFTGSIDRSVAVLQRLPWGSIVIPARAEPYASLIAKAVEMLECLDEGSSSERGVARRLAEIIMLQIVGYARERLLKANLAFGSIQHDEYVPGYRLKQKVQFERFGSNNPVKIPGLGSFEGIKTSIFLEVEGAAHYLPAYAGNLDIMTSAGLKTAEKIAARRLQQETA